MVCQELIDILWNVNKISECHKIGKDVELIDTLWNVNFFIKRIPDFILRINRYIMECKLKNSIGFPVAADELIDTLWNVNKYKIGQEERVSITN